MTPDLFDFATEREEAELRRDRGITHAVRHATRVDPDWFDRALLALRAFVAERGTRSFLAEEFVAYAREQMGCASPPDGRAFGGVMKRAAATGVIVRVGYALANSSNRSPKCLWRAAA